LFLRQDSNYFNLENENDQHQRNNNNNSDNISNPPIYYVCIDNNQTSLSQTNSKNDLKLVDDLPTYEQAIKVNNWNICI